MKRLMSPMILLSKVGGGWELADCIDKLWILLRSLFVNDVSGKRHLRSKLVLVLKQSDSPFLALFKDLSDTLDEFGIVVAKD